MSSVGSVSPQVASTETLVRPNPSLECAKPAPQPAPAATTSSAAPSDKVQVSAQANQGTTTVKTDAWKKGKNDCLEHILLNQGYTMGEIYGKGKDGKKSLLQDIADQNGLKNPNLLRPGQELKIPPKKGEATSTEDLKKGESSTVSADTGERSTELKAERDDKGKSMTTTVNNGGASAEVRTEVSDKGRIDANVRRDGDTITTQEVAKNSNGSAVTQTTTVNGPEGTRVNIRDTDKTGPNSRASVDDQGNVTVTNPGARGAEDGVTTRVSRNQGLAERIGEWGDNIGRWFVGEKRGDDAVSVDRARSVDVQRRQDGSQTVTITRADGETQVHNRGEDWAMQRGGRWVDEQASRFGRWVGGLFTN